MNLHVQGMCGRSGGPQNTGEAQVIYCPPKTGHQGIAPMNFKAAPVPILKRNIGLIWGGRLSLWRGPGRVCRWHCS